MVSTFNQTEALSSSEVVRASDKKELPQFPMEMRMGLAMSGGIALVLYQSGAAHEALRFMRSWNAPEGSPDYSAAYAQAFQAVPIKPLLDIVTGASAGGINCVLLGHCMATGKAFDAFHDVWIQGADIAHLQYDTAQQPNSLLNRDPLIQSIRAIMFSEPEQEAKDRRKRVGALDLITRLCRTDYRGHCLSTTDAIGHSLSVQTQANVIGFGFEDFDIAKDPVQRALSIEEQLRAGAATSAFPGAFAPVEDFDVPGKWYLDGGLWNNQPLDLAVEAVHDKPAVDRTHRCIFVVQPDPVLGDVRAGRGPEPSALEVLAGVPLMGLNGNLWPAIENILDFNQRSQLYQDLLKDPNVAPALVLYGEVQRDASTRQLGLTATTPASPAEGDTWGPTEETQNAPPGTQILSEGEPPSSPSLLNQVRINAVLFDNDPMLIERWNALLLRLGYLEATPSASAPIALEAIQASLHALKSSGTHDLTRRAVRRKIEELNQGLASQKDSTYTESPQERPSEKHAQTRQDKAVLYAQLELLGQYLNCGRREDACQDTLDQDVSAFRDVFQPHSRFRSPAHQMLNAAEKILKDHAVWSLAKEGRQQEAWPYEEIRDCLRRWMEEVAAHAQKAQSELERSLKKPVHQWSQTATFRNWPHDDHEALAAIINGRPFPRPSGIDYARYILAAISDIAGKKPIDLIRISPDDTRNLNLIGKNEPDPQDPKAPPASKLKLAGEDLEHFSGFFQERWRRNDYIWARLDSAEIFLRTLQTLGVHEGYSLPEAEYETLLQLVQTEILQNEASLWSEADARCKTEVAGVKRGTMPEKAVCEANKQLIGFGDEDISDADEPGLTRKIDYLVDTLIRLLRARSEKTPTALRVVQRLLLSFSYLIKGVTLLTPWKPLYSVLGMILALFLGSAGGIGIEFLCRHDIHRTPIIICAVSGVLLAVSGRLLRRGPRKLYRAK